jgi:CARDB
MRNYAMHVRATSIMLSAICMAVAVSDCGVAATGEAGDEGQAAEATGSDSDGALQAAEATGSDVDEALQAAVAAGDGSQATAVYPWPLHSVVPIFFVPQDWSINSAEVTAEATAIESAMQEVRDYYRTKLGGRTFVLNPLQRVQANGFKEAYGITWTPGGNIYTDGVQVAGNFEAAVVSELHGRGYPTPPGQNESGYSAMLFVKGAGGWAGGREFPSADGGWAIVGDWAIDSLQGAPAVAEGNYWWSGRRKQSGAVAHELGHSFMLPHPPPGSESTSVMGNWGDYPTIGFNTSDKDTLLVTKAAFFPFADLSPTAITYAPAALTPGAVVTFDSGVRNAGNAGTGGFNVKWFVDGVQVGYGGHAGVPANTTLLNGNSAFLWTATAGTHTLSFAVDVDGHVQESNEANNSTAITVSLLADLVPTAITYNPAGLVRGATVLFDSGVRNAGNAGTGGFNVKWFVDGVQVGYGGHAGVPANTTLLNENSAFLWTATAGTHTLSFAVDVDGHVQETNDGNNSIAVTVAVP